MYQSLHSDWLVRLIWTVAEVLYLTQTGVGPRCQAPRALMMLDCKKAQISTKKGNPAPKEARYASNSDDDDDDYVEACCLESVVGRSEVARGAGGACIRV
jgi:hypothetical protein